MRTRPLHLLATAIAALLLLPAAPAAAGGPTSVLLSVPGADSITSLTYLDAEYDQLSTFLGVHQPSGTFAPEPAGPPTDRAAGVNVTWLIHDVSPWRVDRIVLAEGGPWIITSQMDGQGQMGQTEGVWHRPADPAGLMALLRKLGLDLDAAAEAGFEGVAGAPVGGVGDPVADETAADQPAPNQPAPNQPAGTRGWAWALGGLAAGLIAGVALTGAWSRRARIGSPVLPAEADADADAPVEVLVRG